MPRHATPPAGSIQTMLEPNMVGPYWVRVARHLQPQCDRFWIHWWFRPSLDTRGIFEQLANPAGRPPDEPLPPRHAMGLGRLEPIVESIEHSWICPNGAAATGPLTVDALSLLLERTDIRWWDLHLYTQGQIRFVATDGGTEHFAWLYEPEIDAMAASGIPRELFRRH